ncbi:Serine/threonine-protein kinase N [Frankliniella fusca]|uniref:Serine/threonine-protein kinase N n=1 Tax=Frankliniella fusca TaxID=407009 RepID=A0AAE1HH65_9NEOP|nr:Serine/threonine-protein kinase N [Frankliniella fusca]
MRQAGAWQCLAARENSSRAVEGVGRGGEVSGARACAYSAVVLLLLQGAGGAGHPVLYELSHKYGLRTEQVPESELPNMLEELKEHIRREIRKELKIKEGAEKLREVAADRRSVAAIVKAANGRLCELQAELHELEGQIILTQGIQAYGQPYGQAYGQPTLLQTPATPPSAHHNGRGAMAPYGRIGKANPQHSYAFKETPGTILMDL